jgi:large subunit ribosomal protein L32
MPVPKKKTAKARRDQRRSHHALKAVGVSTCPQCGQPKLSHRVCPNCGFYKGRKIQIVD